jgi:hypothetical protein
LKQSGETWLVEPARGEVDHRGVQCFGRLGTFTPLMSRKTSAAPIAALLLPSTKG